MKSTNLDDFFELKATDLGGRIGSLKTKTSTIETPALLPVIHPVRQLIPCNEIAGMGYEAVMTNAFTTYRKLRERSREGIHKIIGFEGSVMTDSGGYQVLEYGSLGIEPEEMASFEEEIGSDIAIVLDKPTGLDVTRKFARETVEETLQAAKRTAKVISKGDIIWTLPIQGGKFLDLVRKSAKSSAELEGFGCFALGSPVEVMEQYDFSLLVQMVLATKKQLPENRPFHLFGAGHPLVLPLAVSLGCDMFDSASYMLYAKQDRYISLTGTVRLDQLEFLGCACKICSSYSAKELRSLPKEARISALARHNLAILKLVIEETKQAIWEGRLWEYVQSATRNHPNSFEAFHTALQSKDGKQEVFETGTPTFKDRGLFIFDDFDMRRPELTRYKRLLELLDLRARKSLLILPETRAKPFLKSKIFEEIQQLAKGKLDRVLVTSLCPNFGLVPAELSDIYPLSQCTNGFIQFPSNDSILKLKKWDNIVILRRQEDDGEAGWFKEQILHYRTANKGIKNRGISSPKKEGKILSRQTQATKPVMTVVTSYKDFKRYVRKLVSSID
jgi:7-cyano-7-deazaguanine tRNA-ribosyltransferase